MPSRRGWGSGLSGDNQLDPPALATGGTGVDVLWHTGTRRRVATAAGRGIATAHALAASTGHALAAATGHGRAATTGHGRAATTGHPTPFR